LFDSLSPSSWKRVGRRILEFKPDAVVFQWWQPFFGPAYRGAIHELRKHSDLPVFFLCHNLLAHDRPPVPGHKTWERLLTRRVFKHVDGFLVHADEMVGQLKDFNATPLVKKIYHPLYNFYLQWDRVQREERDSDDLRLLFFGKVRKYKGLSVFLEAVSRIKGRISFHATIAGEFYVAPVPYRKAAERLGLSDLVTWKERYIPNEEVPKLFRESDLVVLPYLEATQSGVVPVAYQFDVPVIASDVGGLSEVVLEGKTGYLVPPGNPEAIAEKIISFHAGQKKQEFQENIRKFRQKLSWQQVVERIEELLQSYGQKVHE
jgi:glycosyltransferase involved in cell wall biosynthesis